MAGATVEIIGSSTVGDVVAADLARAKAALADLEQSGAGASASVAAGGVGGLVGSLLAGLPNIAQQITGSIMAALDQVAASPPIPIRLDDTAALAAIQGVSTSAQALGATNFEPVRISVDNSDVFAKAQAVEQRIAAIKDKTVTITVNIVTNGSVPDVSGGPSGASTQAHAAGTLSAPGGLTLVGERGPELVNLPRGSQVWGSLDSRQMAAGQSRGGDTYVSALYITAPNNASLADLLRQAQSARGA